MTVETPLGRPRHYANIGKNVQDRQGTGSFFTGLVLQWLRLRGVIVLKTWSGKDSLTPRATASTLVARFNYLLIEQYASDERFIAFDPCSFINKSGKHTYGLGHFWSGCAQSVKWGMEMAAIAIGDVKNHTAFHYSAVRTVLAQNQTLMQFYKLRFQQEFVFRDGKQFLGLNHCQSRQKERLNFPPQS